MCARPRKSPWHRRTAGREDGGEGRGRGEGGEGGGGKGERGEGGKGERGEGGGYIILHTSHHYFTYDGNLKDTPWRHGLFRIYKGLNLTNTEPHTSSLTKLTAECITESRVDDEQENAAADDAKRRFPLLYSLLHEDTTNLNNRCHSGHVHTYFRPRT